MFLIEKKFFEKYFFDKFFFEKNIKVLYPKKVVHKNAIKIVEGVKIVASLAQIVASFMDFWWRDLAKLWRFSNSDLW